MEASLAEWGLIGVVFVGILQCLCIPVPGIVVLGPMGVLAAKGEVALWHVAAAYVFGEIIGDFLAFGLSTWFAPTIRRIAPRLYAKRDHPFVKKWLVDTPVRGLWIAMFLSYFRGVINYLAPHLGIRFRLFAPTVILRDIVTVPPYVVFVTGGVQYLTHNQHLIPIALGLGLAVVVAYLFWRRSRKPFEPSLGE